MRPTDKGKEVLGKDIGKGEKKRARMESASGVHDRRVVCPSGHEKPTFVRWIRILAPLTKGGSGSGTAFSMVIFSVLAKISA